MARRSGITWPAGTGDGSRRGAFAIGACLLTAACAWAQTIEVHSEFRRINTEGEVVTLDRGGPVREILSPAVARNGYASFHLTVSAPRQKWFTLHIGQNPEKAVRVALYREIYQQSGKEWVPDALEPVELPYRGVVPDDCRTVSFWMDLWIPESSPTRRVKVEPQLNIEERWIIYPMEVRIKAVRIPTMGVPLGAAAKVEDPADAAARAPLRRYLCGKDGQTAQGLLTVRRLIARNARQDMALAVSLERRLGREAITGKMLEVLGATDRAGWCAAPGFPAALGPEWYLRVRDFLFRGEDR
jgi:hypothetical protein